MSNRTYSALSLLAVAGLASSLMACSKEEEKKAAWSCHSMDVPQGEVLRCSSAALTEDGTSAPTSLTSDGYYPTTTVGGAGSTTGTAPIGTDGTSSTGTATGGTGSATGTDGTTVGTDSTSSVGEGSGYGSGSYVPGAGGTSITSDATSSTGVITYECFPGDTNPDCPPADSYDGMNTGGSGGTATGASLNSDGTASTGDGTATGGGAGSTAGTGTTAGTTDGTSSTGTATGGAGSTTGTGSTGSGTGGGTAGSTDGTAVNSDGTSSTGGNGGGGGANSSNKYPGPDECAYVPDLPYCANGSAGNSTDGTPGTGGAAGGATASTPEGSTTSGTTDGTSTKGNGNGSGGNGSKAGTGTGTTDGSGTGTGDTGGTGGTTGGTTDGTSTTGGGGSKSGSSSTTGGGGTSASGTKPNGKHYKCVKDGKGNKSCESIPDCPTGSAPSNGACVDTGSTSGSPTGGTTDGTGSTPTGSTPPDGKTPPPSGSSTPGSSEVLRPNDGGCWVTGGGFIVSKNNLTGAAADGHDNYGGNAKPMKDGRIQGHWNHVDHGTKNHAKGKPEYIVCRKIADEPGPAQPGCKKGYCMNQVYFGGHAEWRDHAKGVWESGYWFDVVAKDHGEPGSQPHAKNEGFPDTYHFTIRKIDDANAQASGTVVYEVGRDSVKGGDGIIVGGNIQIHPPNNGHPYTAMTLPSWVKFENPAQ